MLQIRLAPLTSPRPQVIGLLGVLGFSALLLGAGPAARAANTQSEINSTSEPLPLSPRLAAALAPIETGSVGTGPASSGPVVATPERSPAPTIAAAGRVREITPATRFSPAPQPAPSATPLRSRPSALPLGPAGRPAAAARPAPVPAWTGRTLAPITLAEAMAFPAPSPAPTLAEDATPAPTVPVPEKALPPSTSPPLELELTANNQSFDGQRQRFVAIGQAMASLAGGRLLADRIEFDTETRTLLAIGSVRFQRGQQYLQASLMRYSLPEGTGEMQDVYGVIDLDGSAQDFDLETTPSVPLPSPEPLGCTPAIPPVPDWQPYPWAATVWGGQMFHSDFGQTFSFKGVFRPETMLGAGVMRRLIKAGPFALDLDINTFGHWASAQKGSKYVGPYSATEVKSLSTDSQSFAEFTVGFMLRAWLQPWLSLGFEEGVSLTTSISEYEDTYRERSSRFLNYLAFEVEALFTPEWSAVGRIHHRSGAFGTYNGVREGSNAYLLGLRYRYGSDRPGRPSPILPPAQGCPGALPPGSDGPEGLAEQLEMVTLGPNRPAGMAGGSATTSTAPTGAAASSPTAGDATDSRTDATPATRPGGNLWSRAREQERLRREAISGIDQHVRDLIFVRSLVAERRYGFPSQLSTPDDANQFGQVRPPQLADLTTKSNRQLLQGSISRWRIQARRLRITPTTLAGDRVAFTNDPFTPAQSWVDSENVVATLTPNGETVIKADSNRLLLEDRLPIPVRRQTVIKKQEEVENRWVLSVDKTDRDGLYGGYDIPIRFGRSGELVLQPQFMIQRAYNGTTDSYPPPGASAGDSPETQDITTGDLFGLEAKLKTPLAGFDADATLQISTFDPANFDNGTRTWGDLSRNVTLPLVGESTLRLFGAYRYRVWNGSLGEENVYSAYGAALEDTGVFPNWGQLQSNYLWRVAMGNYQANAFDSTHLSDLWRTNAFGSINASLPLWTGKPAPLTASQAYANTAVPVVPGLMLNANVIGSLAYYGDGRNQNTISLSGGPTLTLGHFVKPFLDFTRFTITGSATLRQGVSPLSFDRAVDLGTVGIGLTQQIIGPVVFNGGIGFNVDPGSPYYGDITASYVELRWQRRSYEIGIFYSPYDGLGGVRVKLNDFNFSGTGVPFVPYHPSQQATNPLF